MSRWLGMIGVLISLCSGCAGRPKVIDPLGEVTGGKTDLPRADFPRFEPASGFRIRPTPLAGGGQRWWWVDPAGKVVFPVGKDSLLIHDLSLMKGYAGRRFPFPGQVPLSLEPGFPEYLENDWLKRPMRPEREFMALRLDEQIPFPANVLDRALQLDAKEMTYRTASKWLYKERSNSSTLGLTERERETFLIRIIHDYYSFSALAVRKIYPETPILSQVHRIEDFELRPLRDLTQQFCDVIQVRYPRGERLGEVALRQFLSPVRKPVWLRDVPVGASMKWLLPLLRNPQVIGWDWDRSRAWSAEEAEYVKRFEKDLPAILAEVQRSRSSSDK